MEINKFGQVKVSEQEAFNAVYSGSISNFDNLFFEEHVAKKFNDSISKNKDAIKEIQPLIDIEEDIELFDEANQCTWFMPDNYCSNLIDILYESCTTQKEKDRVDKELELFIQHGMFDLLFYLKYLVDTMRENNIVWGVGRGSSVASYVLYLIGIHKIDSIKFDLDINEFLKEI